MSLSLWDRVVNRARITTQGRAACFHIAASLVEGKQGLEIGGPSGVFASTSMPLYPRVGALDNCDFARSTTWANHSEGFLYSPQKPAGKTIFADGSNLSGIADHTYDFILSSNNLEHFANPVKALKEWQRVLRPGGAILLVLPNYVYTFDHRRVPTPVSHMMQDYEQDTQEDDLTHLPEILARHDLSRDVAAGTLEEFSERSRHNFTNRCLHHHVFDTNNSRELMTTLGMDVLAVETAWPQHIFVLSRIP